jgi:hypothetical protein
VQLSRVIDGKKYMWDGVERAGEAEAAAVLERYQSMGFDAMLVEEDQRFFLFTRRVVAGATVEGAPPS